MLQLGMLQFDIPEDPGRCGALIEKGLEELGLVSGLVVLPELFHTPYSALPGGTIALDDPLLEEISHLTERAEELVLCGSLALTTGDKLANAFTLFYRGRTIPVYEKIHLFSPMDELSFMVPGQRLGVLEHEFDGESWRVGFAVCYDLRFPELFRLLRDAGCDLIVLSAQWPLSRRVAWRTLLAARAVENQIFVAGVNRTGVDGPVRFAGSSGVYRPSGERVAGLEENPGGTVAHLDLDDLTRARRLFDSSRDRRFDAYALERRVPVERFEL